MTLTACSEKVVEPNGSHTVGDALSARGGNDNGGKKPKPPREDPPAAWTTAQEIVYARSVTKRGTIEHQIVVASSIGLDEAILVSGEVEVRHPVWSASGDTVFFYVSTGFDGRGIYAVRRDPVTNSASAPEFQFPVVSGGLPAMSPDGSKMAYVDFGVEPGDIWVRQRAPGGSWGNPINIDGNGPDIVGWHPSWASDSRRLVATKDQDLVVYDIEFDGVGGIDQISETSITAGGPLEGQIFGGESSWARNGDRIVFGNPSGLSIIDFNNPGDITTCPLPANGSGIPSWSPDDTRIVHGGGTGGDIMVMTLGSTQSGACPVDTSDDVIFSNSSKCSGRSCTRVREPNWRRF